MMRSPIGAILLASGLLLLAGCGRLERGPGKAWDRLRRAIEAQDGEAMLSLLPEAWQRVCMRWAEDARARGSPGDLARWLGVMPAELSTMTTRAMAARLVLTRSGSEYTREHVETITSVHWLPMAPDRMSIVTSRAELSLAVLEGWTRLRADPRDAGVDASMRAEIARRGIREYDFGLLGGQWRWLPSHILRTRIPLPLLQEAP